MKKLILLVSTISMLCAWQVNNSSGGTELELISSNNTLYLGGGNAGFKVDGGVLQYKHQGSSWIALSSDGSGNIWEQNSTTNDISYNNGNIVLTNLPVYADNASATSAGLIEGTVYRTTTGELRIVIPSE